MRLICWFLFLTVLTPPARAAELPAIHPGHPRMAFQPATARQEAARLTRSPFWEEFRRRAAGHLDAGGETPGALADAICQGGLLALVTDDRAAGEKVGRAVERLARLVREGRWQVRDDLAQGRFLTDIAFGYDWSYNFLTPDQRRAGAETLVRLAAYSRETFPHYFREGHFTAFNNHTHWNHVGVGAAGFAAAGEHPEGRKLAEYSYDVFTRVFLPVFERWVGPEGMWNEGTHYNQVAYKPTFLWMAAAGPATGRDFFQAPWVRRSAYYWVYLTRPDDTMTILGDWFADRRGDTITNLHARTFWITSRAASAHRDRHLQAFAQRQLPWALRKPPEVWNLLWYDPDLATRPVAELPPSRLFRADPKVGGGETLAVLRSGWGPDTRLITLAMGDWLGHHDHYDSSAFTIYYKGDLAIDPGYAGEETISWTHYRRTIAHNSLLVPVPEEQAVRDEPRLRERGWGYDGGQRVPLLHDRPRNPEQFFAVSNPEYPGTSLFETGECLEFATKPEYDYVVGDATRAYHLSQLTRFVRHLVFVKPDVVVLYDVVETPAGRRPRWLLQSVRRPTVSGDLLTVQSGPWEPGLRERILGPAAVSDGGAPQPGGELRVRTLLPTDAVTTVHTAPGVKAYFEPRSAEPFFRTEIAAPAGSEHRFLHVMQITDAGAPERVESRWEREGEWLWVRLQTPAGERRVGLRWDGKPGVRYRS